MDKWRFYGLICENGAMITNNYGQARYCRNTYARGARLIKGFHTYEEANKYCVNHLIGLVIMYGKFVPDLLQVGRFYATSKLPYEE